MFTLYALPYSKGCTYLACLSKIIYLVLGQAKASMKKVQQVIGAFDKIDLPELNLFNLDCKVDTGAYTSAIHCHRVHLIESDGIEWLSFHLLDPSHPAYNNQAYRSRNFAERVVRSSSGHAEYRYVIQTKICLFGKLFDIEFTLADREQMRYPILIGRKFLRQYHFLVDVRQRHLSFRQKKAY